MPLGYMQNKATLIPSRIPCFDEVNRWLNLRLLCGTTTKKKAQQYEYMRRFHKVSRSLDSMAGDESEKGVCSPEKRGLHRANGAEPQVVGLTPQTTNERKTDTMKTYILRDPKPVEPQKSTRPPRPEPARPATTAAPLERPAMTAKGPVLFIGLDVHNDSIAVSLAPSDSTEVRRYGIIGGEHDDVLKLAKKLQAAHPGTAFKVLLRSRDRGALPCAAVCARTGWTASWCVPRRCRANPASGSRPTGGMPTTWRGCIGPGS